MPPLINIARLLSLLRDSVERDSDFLTLQMGICTSAVVIRLVLEYVPEFLETAATFGATRGFRRRFSKDKVWYPRWMKRFEVSGAVLVVIGVSGELRTESARGVDESILRGLSNSTTAVLQQSAADANKDAGDAKERASTLEVEAATLRKQAEDERLARVTLEEGIAWRRLTKKSVML